MVRSGRGPDPLLKEAGQFGCGYSATPLYDPPSIVCLVGSAPERDLRLCGTPAALETLINVEIFL